MNTITAPLLEAMAPMLGPTVTNIFQLMGIAEEEIAAAIERHPLESVTINATFSVLCPRMNLFGGKTHDLYRNHVQEMIARVRAGKDTRPGTKAEIIAAMSEASFAAVLTASAHTLMDRLMMEVFPEYEQPDGWAPQEEWDGACDDTLATARKLVRDETRTIEQKRRSE